jgi:hypothetical protein
MEDQKLHDPVFEHPAKLAPDDTKTLEPSDKNKSPLDTITAAVKELKESEQRMALRTPATQTGTSSAPVVTFGDYLKKNALPLLIIVILLIFGIVQAVQIANLRKSVDTLSCTIGILTGTVNNTSNSVSDLKSKITDNKKNQIDLIRKLKSEYATGYNQILAKEKYLNQLNQTSTIQKIEATLENFWKRILSSFN